MGERIFVSRDQEASVTGKLRHSLVFAFVIAAVALAGGRAFALTFEDIAGRWCGSVSSYTFTPTTLTVILYAENSPREYPIDSYQYEPDVITVTWQRDGEKLFTKFGELNIAAGTMVQLRNDAGPRREFRKCAG
jgi:hypothetical protein